MERRNQVEQRKHPSLAQRVQDLLNARDGQLAEAADFVNFFVVDGDRNASRLLRDDHQRARLRRGKVLDQACRGVLVEGDVDIVGQHWVDQVEPGSVRHATFRDRTIERHQGARTNIRLGLVENITCCSIAKGVHPGP